MSSVRVRLSHLSSGRPAGRGRCLPGLCWVEGSLPPSSGPWIPLKVLCAEKPVCSGRASPRLCESPCTKQLSLPRGLHSTGDLAGSDWGCMECKRSKAREKGCASSSVWLLSQADESLSLESLSCGWGWVGCQETRHRSRHQETHPLIRTPRMTAAKLVLLCC